eukprot:TRINITY_DN5826_c0_g2_i1.p1 TRINITY_DN5826_c0_g2~~TRINITY_DN5826_c0_g2_i1.p1  ORF type:complete len:169 (-),score=36.29 TRINITY_DN5826_c0_g2_i1:110-616(-)
MFARRLAFLPGRNLFRNQQFASSQFSSSASPLKTQEESLPYVTTIPYTKESTKMFGIDLVPSAPLVFYKINQKLLRQIQRFPEELYNRHLLEDYIKFKLKVVERAESYVDIEQQLGGQIEELIEDTEDNLKSLNYMLNLEIYSALYPDRFEFTFETRKRGKIHRQSNE